jgi:hypothetical protein
MDWLQNRDLAKQDDGSWEAVTRFTKDPAHFRFARSYACPLDQPTTTTRHQLHPHLQALVRRGPDQDPAVREALSRNATSFTSFWLVRSQRSLARMHIGCTAPDFDRRYAGLGCRPTTSSPQPPRASVRSRKDEPRASWQGNGGTYAQGDGFAVRVALSGQGGQAHGAFSAYIAFPFVMALVLSRLQVLGLLPSTVSRAQGLP